MININKNAKGMKSDVYETLSKDEKPRADFWRALLLKLSLRVNEEEQTVPALSPINIASAHLSRVTKVVSSWREVATKSEGEMYVKGEVDTFHLQQESSAWSMAGLTKSALELVEGSVSGSSGNPSDDKTPDHGETIKELIAHESGLPETKDTPYFNHEKFFEHLQSYKALSRPGTYHQAMGETLMYAEVVTSTNTLLEK